MTEPATTEIEFIAKQTQTAFITSRAEADLFSCRMGEGKSAALCWAIYYHTLHNPGANWALIRDTWENLQATTLLEFFKWFQKGVMIDWSASQKRATWRPGPLEQGGSGLSGSVVMIGMDVPGDAHKLQSRELAGFAMDEPAPAAESGGISEFVFQAAMTRLRQPGMNWYAAKLAQNSSDETHWTYRVFFEPGTSGNPDLKLLAKQSRGYRVFQTAEPENLSNLPPGYYQTMTERFRQAGRNDLADRFAGGKVGFQQPGKPVTPEFSRVNHVTPGLRPVSQAPLSLCWDFGGNPTCLFTQQTPMGHWNVLEAHVSDGGMGIFELIEEVVAGRIEKNFHGAEILHYGDPAGDAPGDASVVVTAVRTLRDMLGGRWFPGPQKWDPRIQPLRRVLTTMRNGVGLVQIDEEHAKALWHALRGGWHFRIGANGVASDRPAKDIHCVDMETRILTHEGFKSCGDVYNGLPVYGYDTELQQIVDDEILSLHGGPARETLSFQSATVDMVVTPNHRCLAERRLSRKGIYELEMIVLAENLHAGHQIRCQAPWRGRQPKDREFSDEFIRMAAWVCTDGSYCGNGQVWVVQKSGRYADEIVRLSKQWPGAKDAEWKAGMVTIRLRWEAAWLMRSLMPDKYPSGEFIRSMTAGQRRLFLYTSMKGDGTTRGAWPELERIERNRDLWQSQETWRIACGKKGEAESMQIIALTLGLRAVVRPKPGYWEVTILRHGPFSQIAKCENSVQKDVRTDVWCPTTRTGFWVAERNGRVFITGNSHPGDAFGYGAALMYPGGILRVRGRNSGFKQDRRPSYRRSTMRAPVADMFNAQPETQIPEDGDEIITPSPPQTYMRPRRARR